MLGCVDIGVLLRHVDRLIAWLLHILLLGWLKYGTSGWWLLVAAWLRLLVATWWRLLVDARWRLCINNLFRTVQRLLHCC